MAATVAAAAAAKLQPAPNRILDFFHRLIAGGLISVSALGFGVVTYGMYRVAVVKPRERRAAQARALADGSEIQGAAAAAAESQAAAGSQELQ